MKHKIKGMPSPTTQELFEQLDSALDLVSELKELNDVLKADIAWLEKQTKPCSQARSLGLIGIGILIGISIGLVIVVLINNFL